MLRDAGRENVMSEIAWNFYSRWIRDAFSLSVGKSWGNLFSGKNEPAMMVVNDSINQNLHRTEALGTFGVCVYGGCSGKIKEPLRVHED